MSLKSINKNNWIEKQNILNEIKNYNMTLQEIRFFTIYLSKINVRDINTRIVTFTLSDFCAIMDIAKVNISVMQDITDKLLSKIIRIFDIDGGYTSFQLFKRCKVYKNKNNEWYIEIDAHDESLPLMFKFKEKYFKYELWNMLKLTSVNQIRMYELLKQYEKLKERTIELDVLKSYLSIDKEKYNRFNNFKVRILDKSKIALKENTDIFFDYILIKNKNKITHVKFFIFKNKKYTKKITLEDFINMNKKLNIKF